MAGVTRIVHHELQKLRRMFQLLTGPYLHRSGLLERLPRVGVAHGGWVFDP